MKIKALFVLLALCAVISCSDNDDFDSMPEPVSVGGVVTYGVRGEGSTAFINSKEALQQTLPNGYEVFADKVDFSKNNLLLIYGASSYGISHINKNVTRNKDKFYFEINVQQNDLCVIESWCIAFVVAKEMSRKDIDVLINYRR